MSLNGELLAEATRLYFDRRVEAADSSFKCSLESPWDLPLFPQNTCNSPSSTVAPSQQI